MSTIPWLDVEQMPVQSHFIGETGGGSLRRATKTRLLEPRWSPPSAAQPPQPVAPAQDTRAQARQYGYNLVAGALQNLRLVAESLSQPGQLLQPVVSTSNPSILSASAGPGALSATYSVVINSLAAAQSNVSAPFASATQAGALGTGPLSIQVGSAAATSYPVDSTTTLQSLADDINAASAGVLANVLNDGQSFRLQISAQASGAAQALQFSDANTELSMENTVLQAAQDANLSVNGVLTLTSPTNIFKQAFSGIFLQANQVSSVPQVVSVELSSSAAAAGLQALVASYNTVQTTIASVSPLSSGDNPSSLFGDATLRTLQSQLQDAVDLTPATAGSYAALSMVGVSTQADATLTIDSTAANNAVSANPDSFAALLATDASQLAAIATTYADPASGILPELSRSLAMEDSDDALLLNDMQDAMLTWRSTLQKRFVDVEGAMAQLREQQAALLALPAPMSDGSQVDEADEPIDATSGQQGAGN